MHTWTTFKHMTCTDRHSSNSVTPEPWALYWNHVPWNFICPDTPRSRLLIKPYCLSWMLVNLKSHTLTHSLFISLTHTHTLMSRAAMSCVIVKPFIFTFSADNPAASVLESPLLSNRTKSTFFLLYININITTELSGGTSYKKRSKVHIQKKKKEKKHIISFIFLYSVSRTC